MSFRTSRIALGGLLASFALVACSTAEDKPSSEAIVLFNGKDLTNFYTYLGSPNGGGKAYGKNVDPKKVFSVVEEDGKPAIRVSGEVFGCFTTEKEFENYKLVAEFKWGKKTFPPREKATRDSGILLHCIGEDGDHGGVWMESVECQMIEGGTGDFIVCGGKKNRPKITCEVETRGGQPYYKAGADKKEFKGGRVNWFARSPKWTDTLDFRGDKDVEKPAGEWNVLECLCVGDKITNILNGVVVNEASNVFPTKGKLLFQSEGAEVFFRNIVLIPTK